MSCQRSMTSGSPALATFASIDAAFEREISRKLGALEWSAVEGAADHGDHGDVADAV